MPTPKPNPPPIDLAEDWLDYSEQRHGQRLQVLRFSFAVSVAVLVLVGSFQVVTDRHQEPDLPKLTIDLIGTVVSASINPLRRD